MVAVPYCGFQYVCGMAVEMCHFTNYIIPYVGDNPLAFASFFLAFAGILSITSDVSGTAPVHCFLENCYVYIILVKDGFQMFFFLVEATNICLEYIKI